MDTSGEKMRKADDTVKAEYDIWNETKRTDLKATFIDFADRNIVYFQKVELYMKIKPNYKILLRP